MQRHLLSFAMRSNTELQHQCWASFCIPTAAPCLSMLQRQGEHKAGDDRGTNLGFLSRNTWHNSPRVTQELSGYKEKSCCYNKNGTEKGNSLCLVPSLRLKETFTVSFTVKIQKDNNCGCSCRMLLQPLKMVLLFQDEPQRDKIWVGQVERTVTLPGRQSRTDKAGNKD